MLPGCQQLSLRLLGFFLLLHDLHNQIHSISDWILFLSIIFHNSEETAGRFRIKGSKIWWQMQRQDLAKPVNMCRISIISLKGKQKKTAELPWGCMFYRFITRSRSFASLDIQNKQIPSTFSASTVARTNPPLSH